MMLEAGRLPVVLAATLLIGGAGQAQEERCHLHAPADYPSFSKQPLVIPRVGDARACAELNRARFGARGRCHCSADGLGGERMRPPDYRPPEIDDRLP